MENIPLVIAGKQFRSRLLLRTGKFSSHAEMQKALYKASRVEIAIVALRRGRHTYPERKIPPFATVLNYIDSRRFLVLANKSGEP
ncbi:Thiazole synthase [Candidatus Xiphinematobacter sp. Idaho Grape]|uniref:hypothetical protein n=1 Tax=Candidatus Xiphinematobacter sp. Idaho Grape TaxID=1704307 RepID=UPI0007069CDF|nr:hypothetical protein [Candidatus Xiphinematobacter sp. Idaho Grape]ALJ56763.1 Thiazole synthase [Candidatus Xiphinematobacter sp. Idaho Grape]